MPGLLSVQEGNRVIGPYPRELRRKAVASANQVLSEFIAAGQVWYVSRPGKRPLCYRHGGV